MDLFDLVHYLHWLSWAQVREKRFYFRQLRHRNEGLVRRAVEMVVLVCLLNLGFLLLVCMKLELILGSVLVGPLTGFCRGVGNGTITIRLAWRVFEVFDT